MDDLPPSLLPLPEDSGPILSEKPTVDGPEILEVGRKRLKPTNAAVAERVAVKMARVLVRVVAESIQPLNPGFFKLEAMRARVGAKSKAQTRRKHEG